MQKFIYFKVVCDVNEDVAQSFLTRTAWDLEVAIQHFFNVSFLKFVKRFKWQQFRIATQKPLKISKMNSRKLDDVDFTKSKLNCIQIDLLIFYFSVNSNELTQVSVTSNAEIGWFGYFKKLIMIPVGFAFYSIEKVMRFVCKFYSKYLFLKLYETCRYVIFQSPITCGSSSSRGVAS